MCVYFNNSIELFVHPYISLHFSSTQYLIFCSFPNYECLNRKVINTKTHKDISPVAALELLGYLTIYHRL
jgi:hypothetical protein